MIKTIFIVLLCLTFIVVLSPYFSVVLDTITVTFNNLLGSFNYIKEFVQVLFNSIFDNYYILLVLTIVLLISIVGTIINNIGG